VFSCPHSGEAGPFRAPCSRERARHARAVLARVVWPAARAWRVTPSDACPWRPERDALAAHEAHKKRVHDGHWRVRAR
jgi:hypothetical protein